MLFPCLSAWIVLFVTINAETISSTQRDALLDAHNSLRALVAQGNLRDGFGTRFPSAANMNRLSWSSELEQAAQEWANRCLLEHSDDSSFGENIGLTTNTTDPVNAAFSMWAAEIDKNNIPSVDNYYSDWTIHVGHFTQLIWAETGKIGCGFQSDCSIFSEALGKNLPASMVVCRYTPSGNLIGKSIYKDGAQCSECSTCIESTGLCDA